MTSISLPTVALREKWRRIQVTAVFAAVVQVISNNLLCFHCVSETFMTADGENFLILGDGIYPTSQHLVTGFPGQALSEAQRSFNRDVNTGRASVEWGFGRVKMAFPFLKDATKFRLRGHNHAIAKTVFVAVFLMNCANCLSGSIASKSYDCAPPSLRSYIKAFRV